MTTPTQMIVEAIQEERRNGLLTIDQANVEMVLRMRFRLVGSKLPAQVRKSLFAAVKVGTLGRMKKDGLKPEAFFHPNFAYLATAERNRIAAESIESLKKCFCIGEPL